VDGFPTRFSNVAEARARWGDRVDRLGRHLWKTDPLSDEVVDAIEALPPGEGWRIFEEGIRGGAKAIPKAPKPMREMLEWATHIPAWVDWDTCDKGGALLMRAGPLGGAVLGARSLVLGYASPGGNKPLVFSGRLKQQAKRRLDETARFVQAVSRPGGMRPFSDGWQITLKVRLIHAQVRRMLLKSNRWDSTKWGHPVNQHDMAGTVLLFSVAILDGLRKLGMNIEHHEAEHFVHLWRWVGRLIGVDEDVLPGSEAEALRLADLISLTMGDPDQDSRDLTRCLFEAAYDGCTTRAQIKQAERNVMFGRLVCRELIGDELADKLAVPKLTLRHAMPMMKRFVGMTERLARAMPLGQRGAVAVGTFYWDRVVEIGLQNATYDFALPKSLSTHAA
jgi:hypothetical protein